VNELIVKSFDQGVVIALLKDGKLVELHNEKSDNSFAVGDIYLGKARKVVPGLNAAFVDVGYEKDGFLHYHDLGPQVRSVNKFVRKTMSGRQNKWSLTDFTLEKDITKGGVVDSVLASKQNVLVQVTKEPISTKGPRISSELSIAGRFLVLVPFSDRVSVSQKIKDPAEKERLKRLIQSIRPKGFGVIIRTVAQGKKVAELDSDLANMLKKWKVIHKKLQKAKAPVKILGELGRVSAILRDILNDSFNSIFVDSQELYDEISRYLQTIAPDKENILKLYKGTQPIFEHFNIERQIKSSFGRSVSMRKGAYLIIEHTEALHVIDVNSGNRTNNVESQEANALEVNLASAEEVARQLRLRDMGGIVVVDFIDMQKAENRKKLFESLKDFMKEDRAKHKILPPSRFGLIEITRQRVRPEMNIKTVESCPACNGKGEVEATVLIVDEIEDKLNHAFVTDKQKSVTICAHPFIAAYLSKGLLSLRMKWFFKYKKWVKIRPIYAYHLIQYAMFDENDEELSL
jgi:ribonuclease G